MARSVKLSRFTPLLESGTGLRSRIAANGLPLYKGVTIIKAGLGNARDRNFYPAETLQRAVREGRFDGLRAYADHPDSVSEEIQPERTIRDMVGVYRRPRWVSEGRNGGRVVADLTLFRSAKWLSDTVDDLLALGQADKIGLSINGRGKTVEKRMQLEESADPIDVNYVEDFLTLRSSDVVTEAGAGGGFQQLLESAQGRRVKETAMNAKQKKALKERKAAILKAMESGDFPKLQTLLKECGCTLEQATAANGGKTTKETGKVRSRVRDAEEAEATARRARAARADEDAEDAEADDQDEDAEDPDAALDAAHAEITAEAEGGGDDDAVPGDDDSEDLDESDDDEGDDDADEADESESPGDEDDGIGEADDEADDAGGAQLRRESRRAAGTHSRAGSVESHPLSSAADKIRRNAERHGEARESLRTEQPLVRGAGKFRRGKQAKNNIKGPGKGRPGFVGAAAIRSGQRGGQKGRRFGEADARLIDKLREENARLSNQLRIRTTADRAKNLLRESAIPEKLRPEILRLMVGKSENEMTRIISYHERLVEAATAEAMEGTDYGSVEGAGARMRESFHGGGRGERVQESDFGRLFEEVGIPTRDEAE